MIRVCSELRMCPGQVSHTHTQESPTRISPRVSTKALRVLCNSVIRRVWHESVLASLGIAR